MAIYIYIIYIYILSPPKKSNCKVLYFDNKTFPLLIKIPTTTTKPPIFSNTQHIPGFPPQTPPLWRHVAVRCTRYPCHFQAESHLTFYGSVTQVERWKDWRILTGLVVSKCPWMEPPSLKKPWRKGHLGLLTISIHHLLTGMILQVGIQCFKHTKNWYKDTRNGRFDFDLCLHSDLATRCWYVHHMLNT